MLDVEIMKESRKDVRIMELIQARNRLLSMQENNYSEETGWKIHDVDCELANLGYEIY